MKKLMIIFIFLSVFLLLGCTKTQQITLLEAQSVFSGIDIDFQSINAYETYEHLPYDRNELFQMHPDTHHVILHIYTSSLADNPLDYKVYLTPTFFYLTQTMQKLEHNLIIHSFFDYQPLFLSHLQIIDFQLINLPYLRSLIDSDIDVSVSKSKHIYELKILMSTHQDKNEYLYIRYDQNQLLGIDLQFEAHFESTKQVSNYLYGKHISFYPIQLDFPDLNLFN